MPLAPAGVEITPRDIAAYRENGYWFGPKVLSDDEIAAARAAIDRLLRFDYDHPIEPYDGFPVQLDPSRNDAGSTSLRKMNNAWWVSDQIRSIVTAPVLGRIAAELSGSNGMRLFKDQVFWKPGAGGRAPRNNVIGWHQDGSAWRFMSALDRAATVWIPLQDTNVSNGCMRYVRASHRWGVFERAGTETFYEQDMAAIQARFSGPDRVWEETPVILSAGQVTCFHSLLFHGSGVNLTEEPRIALSAHLMPLETSYVGGQYHPQVALLGPNARVGTPFAGDCFPRIWPIESEQETR